MVKGDKDGGSDPSICIVGAGIAGIAAGALLKRKLQLNSFTLFDINHDFGGSWLTTRYPNLSTNVPAMLYGYTFELNLDSQKFYPDKDDVLRYLIRVARKYKLHDKARFNTSINSITWQEHRQNWSVVWQTFGQDPIVEEFNIVIMAAGAFRVLHYPEIFKSFTGPSMHSAQWDGNVKLENKVVGVVGCGASGCQIITAIAPVVKKLVCYLRSPPYQVPKGQIHTGPCVRRLFKLLPCLAWIVIAIGWLVMELTACFVIHTPRFAQWAGRSLCLLWMKMNIWDRDLRKAFTPRYKFAGKVPTINDKFYSTFKMKHVNLVKERIEKIEGDEIVTEDGGREKLDVLILCTGYKVQDFFSPIKIVGLRGQDLFQMWNEAWPRTYYGVTSNTTPNMVFLGGPNSITLFGFTFTFECQMNLVVNLIKHMRKTGAHAFQVTRSAQENVFSEVKRNMEKSLYNAPLEESKWGNSLGENTLLWPGTSTSYWLKTKILHKDHFEFYGGSFEEEDV